MSFPRAVSGPHKSLTTLKLDVSKNDLVPTYYDGQDRTGPPSSLKLRSDIKEQRKSGSLHGWYASNGAIFVIYRPFSAKPEADREKLIASGNMSDAWVLMQSGYAGPLVLQMPTERPAIRL